MRALFGVRGPNTMLRKQNPMGLKVSKRTRHYLKKSRLAVIGNILISRFLIQLDEMNVTVFHVHAHMRTARAYVFKLCMKHASHDCSTPPQAGADST